MRKLGKVVLRSLLILVVIVLAIGYIVCLTYVQIEVFKTTETILSESVVEVKEGDYITANSQFSVEGFSKNYFEIQKDKKEVAFSKPSSGGFLELEKTALGQGVYYIHSVSSELVILTITPGDSGTVIVVVTYTFINRITGFLFVTAVFILICFLCLYLWDKISDI